MPEKKLTPADLRSAQKMLRRILWAIGQQELAATNAEAHILEQAERALEEINETTAGTFVDPSIWPLK